LLRNRRDCYMSEPKQAFQMLEMSTGDGQCVPFPEESFCGLGKQTSSVGNVLLEGSALSNPNVEISSNSLHLSDPVNIQVVDTT
jgi:hypothetical protein